MTDLVEAKDVWVTFSRRSAPAVSGVSLSVASGSALGIVGESGSGKTTLARVLVGALMPSRGEVLVSGQPWHSVGRRSTVRQGVQMIFQDPYAALNPWLTAREAVAEVVRNRTKVSRRLAADRADSLLSEVGLSGSVTKRRPRELSGGECQRVGIARALACEPVLLIADEPTSALDVSVQAQILDLLISLRKKHGLALIVISHDLSVVAYVSEEALVMYRGQVVERGQTTALLAQPMHPYTRILVDSVPGVDGPSRFASNSVTGSEGCVFAERCAYMDAECLHAQPSLSAQGDRLVRCVHPLSNGTALRHSGGREGGIAALDEAVARHKSTRMTT
jgi:oligopeptide/dipeptide ABC transporter ATP-binding protein